MTRPPRLLSRAGVVAAALLAAASLGAQQPAHVHDAVAADSTLTDKARSQLEAARRATRRFDTPEAARAAGYFPVFGNVPLQGEHYVRFDLISNGTFDVEQPSVLMFAPVEGKRMLVGAAYAYQHPSALPPPEGFDGSADVWHTHDELSRIAGRNLVMVHSWFIESPGGPFARYNIWLPFLSAGLVPPAASDVADATKRDGLHTLALAIAIATEPPMAFELLEQRIGVALQAKTQPHRDALRALVQRLRDAQRAKDDAAYARLSADAIAHTDSLVDLYRNSVTAPRMREAINRALDEFLGRGH